MQSTLHPLYCGNKNILGIFTHKHAETIQH